jgi:hypothetical protein
MKTTFTTGRTNLNGRDIQVASLTVEGIVTLGEFDRLEKAVKDYRSAFEKSLIDATDVERANRFPIE